MTIIDLVRKKIRDGDYEVTIPHFFEEMADDLVSFDDIEHAMAKGRVRKKFTRDPPGTRYEIVGPAMDGRIIAVVCRFKSTGQVLLITTFEA